jgi:uncharacterized protein (DUF1778 family)
MAAVNSASIRSARLGLRATPEQETVLRRAADVAHKSLTGFILDSTCQAAEQTLLDQRLFIAEQAGIRAMLTHPIDDEAVRFYTRFGFMASPSREQQLLLLLNDARGLSH